MMMVNALLAAFLILVAVSAAVVISMGALALSDIIRQDETARDLRQEETAGGSRGDGKHPTRGAAPEGLCCRSKVKT